MARKFDVRQVRGPVHVKEVEGHGVREWQGHMLAISKQGVRDTVGRNGGRGRKTGMDGQGNAAGSLGPKGVRWGEGSRGGGAAKVDGVTRKYAADLREGAVLVGKEMCFL